MNERGIITIDYLFALVLVSGFSFIIFALSMTLMMSEVVQYITFSSARNYFAAHNDPQAQEEAAFVKYAELRSHPVVEPLLTSGWFELDESRMAIATDIPKMKPELQGYEQAPTQNLFHGTVVWFSSKILEFNIPFYGSTASDELRGGNEFGAYIGSYLGREITQEECENFLTQRWDYFKNLPTGGAASYSEARRTDSYYVAIADNGC